jgi:chromosome transmission fidelity protein 1
MGIVVFAQSYDLLEKVINCNKSHKILDKYENFFDIFCEKRNSGKQDDVFTNYKNSITVNKKNAILFAVVGGKLSEGINFSDDLARVVLVFGLPFPNIKSSEIKLKMAYYDELYALGDSQIKGEDYYQNICMKAVNQSIGRSIRHIKDYSAITLVDFRYSDKKIQNKLPTWILKSGVNLVNNRESMNNHQAMLTNFLKNNKNALI